jgi:hypothetical protein
VGGEADRLGDNGTDGMAHRQNAPNEHGGLLEAYREERLHGFGEGDLVEEVAEIAQENSVRAAALCVRSGDGSGQSNEEIWDRRETDLGDGGHGLHGLGESGAIHDGSGKVGLLEDREVSICGHLTL